MSLKPIDPKTLELNPFYNHWNRMDVINRRK